MISEGKSSVDRLNLSIGSICRSAQSVDRRIFMRQLRQSVAAVLVAGVAMSVPAIAAADYAYAKVESGGSKNAASAFNSGSGYRIANVGDNACDGNWVYGNFSKSGVVERVNNKSGCRSATRIELASSITEVQACVQFNLVPDTCSRFER
ncbi:MAG: hypothetical protein ACRCYX_04170 [Dermatophilaceae bacterium]